MLSLEDARQVVISKWLEPLGRHEACEYRIVDADTVEYDWGWIFFTEIPGSRESYGAVLVDRETGKFTPSQLSNITISLSMERLAESRRSS